MEKSKVYMSNQLACMLPAEALKVLTYIFNWQSQEVIKYYPKQWQKFLHMSIEEIELALQTLNDKKLIDISKIDNNWCIQINKETVNKYFQVEMKVIAEHDGIPMATKVTWNVEEVKQPKSSTPDLTNMSAEDMQRTILMMQAMLNEKKQVAEMVKMASEPTVTDLPF